jgi:ribosomal protein S8
MAAAKPVNRPHPTTVYARTGKGVLSFKNGTAKASDEIAELFSCIDGKASVEELRAQSQMRTKELEQALDTLEENGYIKVFKQGIEQVVPDFTEAPGDAPDLDFTESESLLEIRVREIAKARAEAQANAAQQPPDSTAAAAESAPPAQAEVTARHESLEARIRELEAALSRAEEQVGTERAARENAEGEAKAAARARNDAVKALAQAKASAAKAKQPGEEVETRSLQESLAQAQDRVAHVELQLETERETREKTVQALRKSQSEAEAERNAAEMRVKEMEIALESAEKVDRQNRERVRQLEDQIEAGRRARADADAAFATEAAVARSAITQLAEAKITYEKALTAGREQAERTAQVELELEAERRAREQAEEKASEERAGREKIAQALLEIKKVVGSIEG